MRKRGPRPKPPELKSAAFTMRMRPETREALDAAASASGKSITDEIHDRLTLTFNDPEFTLTDFGGRQPYAILRLAMEHFAKTGAYAYFQKHRAAPRPQDWLDDPYAFDQALKCVIAIFEGFRPKGEVVPPDIPKTGDPLIDAALRDIGASFARGALIDILQAETDLPQSVGDGDLRKRIADDLGATLRRRLGQPIVDRRFTRKGGKR